MAGHRLIRALILSATAAVSVMGVTAQAANTIAGSPHDLTNMSTVYNSHQGSWFDNFNQICVYCHTPHNANTANNGQLLWNRPLSTASYTLYQSPTYNSGATTSAPDATSSSSLCLSCHDGTIAVDSVLRRPITGNIVTAPSHAKMDGSSGNCGTCHQPGLFTGGTPGVGAELTLSQVRHGFLGTDISNDHPVNFTYDPAVDPGLRPAAAVTAAGLKLPGGKVQCASCHDPHVPLEKAFLRKSNVASALCSTCHTK